MSMLVSVYFAAFSMPFFFQLYMYQNGIKLKGTE
jgi:hypothetical protein